MSKKRRNRDKHMVPRLPECTWGATDEACRNNHKHMPIGGYALTTKPKDFQSLKPKPAPVTAYKYVPSCKHFRDEVKIGEYTVLASGHSDTPDKWIDDLDSPKGAVKPDLACYFASSWVQGRVWTSPGVDIPGLNDAYSKLDFISYPWPDFGVPDMERWKSVAIYLALAVEEGRTVELGCIGGHGRTGSALATIAVCLGISPGAAIRHIRETYCKEAVENAKQADFVRDFAIELDVAVDTEVFNEERSKGHKESAYASGSSGKWLGQGPTCKNCKHKESLHDDKHEKFDDCKCVTFEAEEEKVKEADEDTCLTCGHDDMSHDEHVYETGVFTWCAEMDLKNPKVSCSCTELKLPDYDDEGLDEHGNESTHGTIGCDVAQGECFKALVGDEPAFACKGECELTAISYQTSKGGEST